MVWNISLHTQERRESLQKKKKKEEILIGLSNLAEGELDLKKLRSTRFQVWPSVSKYRIVS